MRLRLSRKKSVKALEIYLPAVLILVSSICSHGTSQREQALEKAALLMYEMPDSAMSFVKKTEPKLAKAFLAEPEDADSVTNAVFNYYGKHGSRTIRILCRGLHQVGKVQFPSGR